MNNSIWTGITLSLFGLSAVYVSAKAFWKARREDYNNEPQNKKLDPVSRRIMLAVGLSFILFGVYMIIGNL